MQYLRSKIPSDVAPSRMPSALNQKPIPSLCFSLLVRGPGLYYYFCHSGNPSHEPAILRTPRGYLRALHNPPADAPRRSCGATRALRMPCGRPADPAAWALAPPPPPPFWGFTHPPPPPPPAPPPPPPPIVLGFTKHAPRPRPGPGPRPGRAGP